MDNGLALDGDREGLEKLYDYEHGGHHPVHLGECLGPDGQNRYRVIHKLRSGGFANVWLCQDLTHDIPRYVGLKILVADASKSDCPELRVNQLNSLFSQEEKKYSEYHICLPSDHFSRESPNGLHFCFAYPVLGPRVSRLPSDFANFSTKLRDVALQSTKALSMLHRHGICHGDFTPANILLRVNGLDGLSESQLLEELGEPKRVPVLGPSCEFHLQIFSDLSEETDEPRQYTALVPSGEPHTNPSAPQYLVRPIYWGYVSSKYISDQAYVIDLGESFDISSPPDNLGTPAAYCSPELLLDKKVGLPCDLWALGCTLFEIRTGDKLFGSFEGDEDNTLFAMAYLLGKLPEPWWSKTWKNRSEYFEDDVDTQGRVQRPAWEMEGFANMTRGGKPLEEARSIRDALMRDPFAVNMALRSPPSPEEVDLLDNLLGKLLQWDDQKRPCAEEVQEHPWFKMEAS